MFRVSFLIIFFLVVTANFAFSDTFTVTSNGDSGPGTFRQALLDAEANGSAVSDKIIFNLPGSTINDRTIRLRSQLPNVSSRLIIDGSSQPSSTFGVSGAKVIIEREYTNVYYHGLVIGAKTYNEAVNDIEIYGLYIRNFADITSLSNVNTSQGSGIIVDYNAKNVKIGAPGKGNVICGNVNGIQVNSSSYWNGTSNIISSGTITIQSNLIGLLDNGTTGNTNQTGINIQVYDRTVNIGGDNSNEENVIAANGTDILIDRSSYYYSATRVPVNIINNKIGTDYSGTKDFKTLPIFSQTANIDMYGIRANAAMTDLNILKNVISGHLSCGISVANASFLITGNYIGTDKNGTADLGNTTGIRIESGAQGNIGRSATGDKNFIGYNRYGIDVLSDKPVVISRNSIFCNKQFGIGKATNAPQTYIQVLKKRANYISGKATPNAEVELFYSDNCPGSCQGKTYFFTTSADNNGNWEYTGNLTGHVVATASMPTYVTSMFSTAGLRNNEAAVEPVTCKGAGSITISEPREGIDFKWFRLESNNTSVFIGNSQSVRNLDVGTYEVQINDGCTTVSHTFYITDQILTTPVITEPIPQCGETTFLFRATTKRGKGTIVYRWKNANGQTVGFGENIYLPEGKYTVEVTDDAGCAPISSTPTSQINRRPTPKFNISNRHTKAAACGHANGAITDVEVTDITGTAQYAWYTFDITTRKKDVLVGNTKDLIDVSGGWYALEVTDQGSCSPVLSQEMYISIYNSVEITSGNAMPATCGKPNGSIQGITIKEGDSWALYNNNSGALVRQGVYSGTAFPIEGLAVGNYSLTAKNSTTGCTSSPAPFNISDAPQPVYSFTHNEDPAKCGQVNGSITLTFSRNSPRPLRFEWMDESGHLLNGASDKLENLNEGNYQYIAYDVNECPQLFTFAISRIPLLQINESKVKRSNDYCELNRGSITGIEPVGGLPGYTYVWQNSDGDQVGAGKDMVNVGAGTYKLTLTDNTTCGLAVSREYIIENETREMADPKVGDTRVCYTTEILIQVENVEEGNYQLYQDLSDPTPILESTKGTFIFKVAKTADYYIVRRLGACSSSFAKFHVEVTNDNLVIANIMTPNGDNINDIWSLKGLPDYPDIRIQLYSREGQLVYECIGPYIKPFTGHFRGAELPAGAYYYRIDLRGDCKPLSGSLTLLR
ncbi:gliding motility-associated C-terminal domain-containing protein [Pararcticibacter amylolyticus]|uniref:Ig-like domain-containing protein n=1 Tax=Pararcticibacter amylolyticus TaxID=2173175 RepID=A0A2U2PD64_9SPHI|nr:gliding motility-associated C-terminal domain-containing protein [Pararcticibacter amylolyticus]PWG79336.1 hypothetical protein DDR33_17615 [Pararcticibacter amylolyticus]